jgi:hypothetical protein
MPAFPEIRVGEPTSHGALTVFPLFAETGGRVDYLLADEAIGAGTVTVAEVGDSGSVPTLVVENTGDTAVLFLEGEELRGAKQNRVLNTSVLVAPKSRATIPVSCVEQGRWRFTSRHFGSAGSHASSKLRHVLKRSVGRSTGAGHGHLSDQGEVWKEVSRQMSSLGSDSQTLAMGDTYSAHNDQLAEYRASLPCGEGAVGMAAAVGGRVVSVDLFDKPLTCGKVWHRLLTGLVMDALEASPDEARPGREAVQEILGTLCNAPWRQTQAVGAGEEYRADPGEGRHASALTCDGVVLHGSLIAGSSPAKDA